MAKILVAASPEPRAILQRMLAQHELRCPEGLAQAERWLHEQLFDLIVCSVSFDESRMFDLLRLVRSRVEWQRTPFVCARLRANVLDSRVAREGVAFTCRALGAAAYLDIADFGLEAESGMQAALERFLDTAPGPDQV